MHTKIVIAGLGGVGGYFGGLLAKRYYGSEQVKVIFWARGEHLMEVRKNGLKVITADHEFVARPNLATNDPAEIGIADLVIVATKSYDLEVIIEQLKPCIGQDTIILPLLNGIDSRERIQAILPDQIVLDGCVYIVARLKQAGVVENLGSMQTLYFGLDNFSDERLLWFEYLFKQAGIEALLSEDISRVLWEKFIFISPTATATSYYDKAIGEVLEGDESLRTLNALINEIKQVAQAKGIDVAEDITEKVMNKLKSLPFGATSSMHADFRAQKAQNELQSLTGYVLAESQKYVLETPSYFTAYSELRNRNNRTGLLK